MNEPFFSILIPVYNTEKTLTRCIRSVSGDDRFSIEIIAVDDGSTDSSPELLKKIAQEDDRIRIITHEKNKSLLEARRTGVAACHGKFVLFLDSDDRFTDGALPALYDRLNGSEGDVDVLHFSFRVLPFQKIVPSSEIADPAERLRALLQKENALLPAIFNKVYRGDMLRRAYEKVEGFYANMAEDVYQSIVIAAHAKHFASCSDVCLEYSYDTGLSTRGGMTLAQFRKLMISRDAVLKHTQKFLEENRPELNTEGLAENFLYQSIYEQILIQMREEDKDDALLMLTEFFSNDLLREHLRRMRTEFDRTVAENDIFFIAKKMDNTINTFFPAGTVRRKILHYFWCAIKFLPALLLTGLKKIYRAVKPHPDDVRRKLLSEKKKEEK